jgi:molybdate transport system substrate-binding protein
VVTRIRASLVLLAATSLAVAACSGDAAGAPGGGGGAEPAGPDQVTVIAAASLTEAFQALAEAFESEHPGVSVVLALGGSTGLARQVQAGAPADVFAAASPEAMALVTEAGGTAQEPVVLARNVVELVVPAGNPGEVDALDDLADPRLRVALCAPEVPCGAAAARLFTAAGVVPLPDTWERDVRAVLAKVRLGEVDAGIVYRTDVLAASGEVEGIPVAGAEDVATDYHLAVLMDAPNPAGAHAFVALALSPAGRAILARAGFGLP